MHIKNKTNQHQTLNQTISTFSSLSTPPPKPFQLHDLNANGQLKLNSNYCMFLSHLNSYNKKIRHSQEDICIIEQKLHDFLYSSLKICNSKTGNEAKMYLDQIKKWYDEYSHKRSLTLQCNSTKQGSNDEQELIRTTYKSNLPSNIEVYKRQSFGMTIKKKNVQVDCGTRKRRLKFEDFQEHSETSQRNFDTDSEDEDQIINKVNIRSYKNEILNMKKAIEDKQDKFLLENIYKNKARLETQTANNFYKPFPKSSGITISSKPQKDSILPSFFSTSQSFHQIKKKKLLESLGFKPTKQKQEKEGIEQKENIGNIDGLKLIKNPFEIVKKAKNKKKK